MSPDWGSVAGGGMDDRAGSTAPASISPLFGVKAEGSASMRGEAGFSIGWGLELLSLMRTCSMPSSRERKLGPSDDCLGCKYVQSQ